MEVEQQGVFCNGPPLYGLVAGDAIAVCGSGRLLCARLLQGGNAVCIRVKAEAAARGGSLS